MGHTSLGAFLLKYDRIMRYIKQRHIIIKATPHDQNEYVVGDMCRVDNVRSVCCNGHVMTVKNRQVGLCTCWESDTARTRWEDTNRRPLL